ncbi:MAG: RNA pseudouridine synthase, partial [Clostridia bacterium]|nr:RNA pseudouridine synthase [Clostridia bacterium]
VMVFAKTSKAAQRLNESKKNGEFEKTYLCVTCGEPAKKEGELRNYLKKNERTNNVAVVPMLTSGAKEAVLQYKVIESRQGFSLVRVKLETGRSHQIRVQMANIGCPLFGDRRYGGMPATFKHNLALWSTKLSFPHPTKDERMTYVVYPPCDVSPWQAFNIPLYLANLMF